MNETGPVIVAIDDYKDNLIAVKAFVTEYPVYIKSAFILYPHQISYSKTRMSMIFRHPYINIL